eukprot:1661806-Rhodomonas_salina.1
MVMMMMMPTTTTTTTITTTTRRVCGSRGETTQQHLYLTRCIPNQVHLLLVLETRVCPHGCSRLSARATLPEASARDVPFISPDEEPLAEEPCFVVKQTAKGRGAEEVEGVSVASEAVVSSPSKRGGEGGD